MTESSFQTQLAKTVYVLTEDGHSKSHCCICCVTNRTLVRCQRPDCPLVFCRGCLEELLGGGGEWRAGTAWTCQVCSAGGPPTPQDDSLLCGKENWQANLALLLNPSYIQKVRHCWNPISPYFSIPATFKT